MLELLPLVCQAGQDFADLGRVFVPLLDQPVALRAHLHKARIIKKRFKRLIDVGQCCRCEGQRGEHMGKGLREEVSHKDAPYLKTCAWVRPFLWVWVLYFCI